MTRAMFAAVLSAAMMTAAVQTTPALADARSYCDAYARDVAARKSGAGDVVAGAIGGALFGGVIGGMINKKKGIGKGAIVGAVGGTMLGAGLSAESRRKAYKKAFRACMAEYEPEPVSAGGDGDWIAYCKSKYRSFNPATGMYRTNSGKLRRCQ